MHSARLAAGLATGGVLLFGGPASPSATQPRCVMDPIATGPGTFAAAASDSPRLAGRVYVRLAGRFPCPDGAEWWFEYGLTKQYGQRTQSSLAAVPVVYAPGYAVVRTDVDGLAYNQSYHYRLVVRYPDGEVESGSDGFVRVRSSALRPPQRVRFVMSPRQPRVGTHFDRITVYDAPAGSKVSLQCGGGCSSGFDLRIADERSPVVFRRVRVAASGSIRVVVAGKGVPTATTISPQARGAPTLETECGGYPVILDTKCIDVAIRREGPRVERVVVSNVPRGTRVDIECSGPGCPRRAVSRRSGQSGGRVYTRISVGGYTRVRPGATLRVFVTRPETYGLARTFRVRRNSVTGRSYRCIARGSARRVVACPTEVQVDVGRG